VPHSRRGGDLEAASCPTASEAGLDFRGFFSFWLALGVMSLVGIGSGLIPAWRAARVDPLESLRSE